MILSRLSKYLVNSLIFMLLLGVSCNSKLTRTKAHREVEVTISRDGAGGGKSLNNYSQKTNNGEVVIGVLGKGQIKIENFFEIKNYKNKGEFIVSSLILKREDGSQETWQDAIPLKPGPPIILHPFKSIEICFDIK